MIHAKNATNMIPAFKLPVGGTKWRWNYVKGVHHVENPNYVFLDIEIAKTAKPVCANLSLLCLARIL
jgi:hypothetical protein